ncbi:vomeronasal type-2 receptor 26-like [Leptodactylus fuscus]|uniref:vomeronasal type-2 receptor 26-like n=1 Tax=Leptodactylus fuscus TaxID=238119 RepID=UPI003F4EF947
MVKPGRAKSLEAAGTPKPQKNQGDLQRFLRKKSSSSPARSLKMAPTSRRKQEAGEDSVRDSVADGEQLDFGFATTSKASKAIANAVLAGEEDETSLPGQQVLDNFGTNPPSKITSLLLSHMDILCRSTEGSCLLLQIPVSRCSEPCLPGSRKKTRETIHTCCYDCAPCSEGEISNVTDADSCSKCQSAEWPNEKRDRCLPKVMEFISYHNDTIASVSSSISLFGCLVTGSIFRIFISYRDTPIVRANNRNLSYLLLASIILSFLSVFLFLGRPSDVTCRLRETSFGVFFSVAVSSLLAKTVMVCVAFKSTKPGSPWRKWLSVKLPYTIVLLCSSFQVVICVLWLSISPPFQDLDTHSYPEKIIIRCNEGSDLWFYSMLGYMGLLAAVSFLLAFMVRTLPDSFNEAKYITFSMLLFCSVWMAMIPAYLSTRGKYMVAVEIFAVMASSAGLLACVFFPKCFIILFRSEMNRKTDLLGRRKEIYHPQTESECVDTFIGPEDENVSTPSPIHNKKVKDKFTEEKDSSLENLSVCSMDINTSEELENTKQLNPSTTEQEERIKSYRN